MCRTGDYRNGEAADDRAHFCFLLPPNDQLSGRGQERPGRTQRLRAAVRCSASFGGQTSSQATRSDLLPGDASRQLARLSVFEDHLSCQLVRDGIAHGELSVMTGKVEVDNSLYVSVAQADHVGRIVRRG